MNDYLDQEKPQIPSGGQNSNLKSDCLQYHVLINGSPEYRVLGICKWGFLDISMVSAIYDIRDG